MDRKYKPYTKDSYFYVKYMYSQIYHPRRTFEVGDVVEGAEGSSNESSYREFVKGHSYTTWYQNSKGIIMEVLGLATYNESIVYKIKVEDELSETGYNDLFAYVRTEGIQHRRTK